MKLTRTGSFAHVLLLALACTAALLLSGCGVSDATVSTPAPTANPTAEPFIADMEAATEMLWQKKGVPGGSNQYTVLDYAVSEDGFVRGVILYRDAARLNEGNLVVYTETSATEISYGEADDVYRYTDKCSLEIRNGDTVSYYVEDYNTGEVINFAVKCSMLEDGTKHFETVAGTQ